MAERQVLRDPIKVGGSDELRSSHGPATFGAFALAQMASARSPEEDFAGAGYFETFGY
jgi:hypothetical protein